MTASAGRRAASTVLVLAVLAALLLTVGAATGRLRTAAVLTGSMAPFAPTGSAVLTVSVPTADLRPGDVVTLRAPAPWSSVVTHRVVGAERRADGAVVLTTKGDRNDSVDPWQAAVREPRVHRVALVVPHLGTVLGATAGDGAARTRDVVVWVLALGWLARLWWPRRGALDGLTIRSPFFDVSHLPAH